ncbi:MAG: Uma2 family endonuclease [Chloroflexota bacterium]
MEARQLLYTIEEFERLADSPENRDRLLELVNGEIVEKVPTEKHGMCVGNIYFHIRTHVQERRGGRVVMEVRYRSPDDRRNAFIPDVAYTSGSEPPVEKGSVPHMPDLAAEVKSPDDSLKDMRTKARYYLAHGTKLVWLVDPQKRFVEIYSPDKEDVLFEDEILDGGDVLSGFQMAIRDIFEDTASG